MMARNSLGAKLRLLLLPALLQYILTLAAGADTKPDFYAPLEDLTRLAPNNRVGGQNFTRCCLQAVEDWRQGDRSGITIWSAKDPFQAFKDADDLRDSDEQFPCGATYNGDDGGAPQVLITYDWCSSRCDGWQRSVSRVLTQWVQPFVGFILPAAVFCLNVPRKMVVDIADGLFPDVLENLKMSWLELIDYKRAGKKFGDAVFIFLTLLFAVGLNVFFVVARAVIAASLGLINVVVWVIVVFSTAAPMMLSGLYEAAVDRQVLHTIEREVRVWKVRQLREQSSAANDVHRVKYQVHLLYAVLVGNLELWQKRDGYDTTSAPGDLEGRRAEYGAAWRDVKDLVDTTIDVESVTERKIVETRLRTMLQCQASFGATIGAPVAFFLGSFLFTIFSNLNTLGDNDTSHALAFGEWWMTIPHIAIVSGGLLAGNNPNTLEAIVSGLKNLTRRDQGQERGVDGRDGGEKSAEEPAAGPEKVAETSQGQSRPGLPRRESVVARTIRGGLKNSYTHFYKSIYQPVWMWERGRSKRNWIREVQTIGAYHVAQASHDDGTPATTTPAQEGKTSILGGLRKLWIASQTQHPLKDVPVLGFIAWSSLIVTASILIIIPWVLAYVTSYYTPAIGLSCRTFTFVLYFLFQLWLTALWFVDFPRREHSPLYTKSGWPTVFYLLTLFGFVGSAFTAIAGTFLQIVGVYRNCKCFMPMSGWAAGNLSFIISSNSAEMIYYANLYWLSTGIASILLLIIFCYLGWWYQRHWRLRFVKVTKDVLMTNPLDEQRWRRGGGREPRAGRGTEMEPADGPRQASMEIVPAEGSSKGKTTKD